MYPGVSYRGLGPGCGGNKVEVGADQSSCNHLGRQWPDSISPSGGIAPVLTLVPSGIPLSAPCCPNDISWVLVSSDRVEIAWSPVRGAELYETKAIAGYSVVECNDPAPACTLSALDCDTKYNITVYSFSEVRGSNLSCSSHYITTGKVLLRCHSLMSRSSPSLCASRGLFSKTHTKGGWRGGSVVKSAAYSSYSG